MSNLLNKRIPDHQKLLELPVGQNRNSIHVQSVHPRLKHQPPLVRGPRLVVVRGPIRARARIQQRRLAGPIRSDSRNEEL